MPPRRRARRNPYLPPTEVECQRCSAIKADGNQCTRSTCKYAGMCWQHTKSQKGLEIKQDEEHPEHGLGLYASRPLPADTIIPYARFPEDHRNIHEVGNRPWPANRYVMCNSHHTVCFDGRSTQSGLGRWVNEVEARQRKNAKITVSNRQRGRAPRAYFKLTRRVRPGEEILTSYGRAYRRDY